MEYADVLHTIWLGVARDLTGSLFIELATHHPQLRDDASFDGRLRRLHRLAQAWCSKHHIRPSTLEEPSSLFFALMQLTDNNQRMTIHVKICKNM